MPSCRAYTEVDSPLSLLNFNRLNARPNLTYGRLRICKSLIYLLLQLVLELSVLLLQNEGYWYRSLETQGQAPRRLQIQFSKGHYDKKASFHDRAPHFGADAGGYHR